MVVTDDGCGKARVKERYNTLKNVPQLVWDRETERRDSEQKPVVDGDPSALALWKMPEEEVLNCVLCLVVGGELGRLFN